MAEKLVSPLSGKIFVVSIEVGQQVEEDDEAFIIEALKMENPIYVPCDGKVAEIKVAVGDMVEEDDLLAVIE